MAEYEENFAAGPVPSEEPQKRMEDTEVALQKVLHDWVGNINTKPVSIIARLRTVVRLHKLPSNVNHFTLADAVSWTRQGRPWRGLLIAVVSPISYQGIQRVLYLSVDCSKPYGVPILFI